MFQFLLAAITLREKRRMTKLIVFDMAGTVINEDNVVYKTLQQAADRGGIAVDLDQVLAIGAGKEKAVALNDIARLHAPTLSKQSIDTIYNDFLKSLEEAYATLHVLPIPGAEELFAELKKRNIKAALNTGYNKKTADQLLARLGWRKGEHIDEVITASDVARARPHADMILAAMSAFVFGTANFFPSSLQ